MAQGTAQVDVFTTVGKQQVAKLMGGITASAFKYIALGTGTSADASVSDTQLGTETSATGLARVLVTPTQSSNVTTWTYTFTNSSTGSVTITEIGIFDNSSGGNMLRHITLGSAAPVVMAVGASLKVTITQTVS